MKSTGDCGTEREKEGKTQNETTIKTQATCESEEEGTMGQVITCGFPGPHTDQHFLQVHRENPWLRLGVF